MYTKVKFTNDDDDDADAKREGYTEDAKIKSKRRFQREVKWHEATQLKINKQELQKQSFAQKSSQQNNQ